MQCILMPKDINKSLLNHFSLVVCGLGKFEERRFRWGAGYHANHLTRTSAFVGAMPRVTSLDRVSEGCHVSCSAPDLAGALRTPAEVFILIPRWLPDLGVTLTRTAVPG